MKWVGLAAAALILTHWLSAGADNIIHPQQYPTTLEVRP